MPADAGRRYRGRIFEMDIMEIVLLAAGGIVFILSFLIPMKKEESSEETRGLAKEEIKTLVSEELEAVRGHVDDVVEEAVTYSIEKTERSLERLSNEKIMAVNEYSDTVLAEIHKNHEEVMFLYDMLNDKHINLKNTVSEVNRTVKEVKETKKEAEEVVNTFQRLAPETVIPLKAPVPAMPQQIFATAPQESVPPVVLPEPALAQGPVMQSAHAVAREPAVSPVSMTVPPVFAAAPVPAAVQTSEAQKVSLASQNAAPMPQKVSLSRQTLPAAQRVAAAPGQPSPVPQQITAAPGQPSPMPQQIRVTAQQISPAPQQAVPAPRKVSSASRQVSPTPQKVSFPASKRESAVPQTVTVSPREFVAPPVFAAAPASVTAQTPVMPQVSAVSQASRSGQIRGSGAPQPSSVINFTQETDVQGRNYNDRVLELYKSGKSNVAIARELNLGVGEVKLVIDLYKNRSEK